MIEFQRKIMGDPVRNEALVRALKKVIVPGKTTVSDIGSGSGFLSFVASKLGAKQCYLYEQSSALQLSKKLAKENGITNCTFIPKYSTEVKSPVQTDIVISETLGNYALEEHMLETLMDAKRFLKPGGTQVPSGLTQFVCPVISSRPWDEINVWKNVGHGLTFPSAESITLQNMYVKTLMTDELLPNGTLVWDTIDFRKSEKSVRNAKVTWKLSKSEVIYGYALFWKCELVPGISLSTKPGDALTHWEQIFLPLLKPISVKANDQLQLQLTSDSRPHIGMRVTWKTTHGTTVQSLDSEAGRT